MKKSSRILIVGHNDVIETSLTQYFESQNFDKVISASHIALNPTIQASVYQLFQDEKPDYVFIASTRAGGIEANIKHGGEFIYHNLESQNNIIYAAQKFGTQKLLYYGASCVYPKECTQPIKEESFLTGEIEQTSAPYAVSKIAGIMLCRAFKKQYDFNAISMIPATIYGPGVDTDLSKAHVMGALIAKFCKAVKEGDNEVVVWGSGKPRREFLYVDDFVEVSTFLMEKYDEDQMVNAGLGEDISIKELAELIAKISGFEGKIRYDDSKPDGAPQKLLDSSRINKLGWKAKIDLEEGVRRTVEWYIDRI